MCTYTREMRVAIEGCCHGELDRIYETVVKTEEREGRKVDLLICCGDFQAVRNHGDLTCMAVPVKYRKMQSFYKYYSGESVAPVMTIFVGGNHEATNHLWELSYGGWVAPNIYYLGNAGVVRFGGLRIAGVSGIYKDRDYRKGHFECPPYSEDTKRSAYHVRSCDVFRLKQLSGHLDIFVSHDWPLGIYHHGNTSRLIQTKPYFEQEIASGTLGSPPLMELLQRLKPDLWFSAHLHVKFAAAYQHEGGGGGGAEGGGGGEGGGRGGGGGEKSGRLTKFLALDKCLPRRKFMQILDIPTRSEPPYHLEYDPEWLVVVKATEPYMRYTWSMWLPPNPLTDNRHNFTPAPAEIDELCQTFSGGLRVPDNFTQTALVYDPTQPTRGHHEVQATENPQTLQFCQKLGIQNPFRPKHTSASTPPLWSTVPTQNPDEIPLDSDEESNPHPQGAQPGRQQNRYPWLEDSSREEGGVSPFHTTDMSSFHAGMEPGPVTNPDEIVLEDSEESDEGIGGEAIEREPLLLPTPSSDPQGAMVGGGEGMMVGGGEGMMVGGGEGMMVGEGEGVTVEEGVMVGEGEGEGVTVGGGDGQKRPKIKRRNIALYGSSCDEV